MPSPGVNPTTTEEFVGFHRVEPTFTEKNHCIFSTSGHSSFFSYFCGQVAVYQAFSMHPCLCHCWCSNWSCANGWGCLMLFGLHPLTTPQSQLQARQRMEILIYDSHPDSTFSVFLPGSLWNQTKWGNETSQFCVLASDRLKAPSWTCKEIRKRLIDDIQIWRYHIMEYVSYQMIWHHILSLHHTKSYTVHIII